MMKIGKAIRVNGRVQGVGFRWSTMALAKELQITGFVRNEADGSVYIEAVGSPLNLAKFAAKIKAGPTPYANVSTFDEQTLEPVPDYTSFNVTGY